MTTHPVLVYHAGPGHNIVHLPPLGFKPPPPNTTATMRVVAWCGAPASPISGYGEREIVEEADVTGTLNITWCPRCFPERAR